MGCHSMDGSKKVGPSLNNIAGRETVVMVDGAEKTFRADKEYIIRSILQPKAEVVKGYRPIMRSYEDTMDEAELQSIADYLMTEGIEVLPQEGNKLLEKIK